MDTIAANDGRKPHEQIQRIRELRPDMILLSGEPMVVTKKVTEIAERIAPARPQPLRQQVCDAGDLCGQQGCPRFGRQRFR